MNEIKVNNSGTKKFLFFEWEFSKDKTISTENFFCLQREALKNSDNMGGNTGVIQQNKETYSFYDQDSITEALWTYADTDESGTIDENEYKNLLANSISNGIIGKNNIDFNSGLQYSISDGGYVIASGLEKDLEADYEELTRILKLYNEIEQEDSSIDTNNDNLLQKEEFKNSILTKLLTSDKGKEIAEKSKPTEKETELTKSISNGIIAKIKKYVSTSMKPAVTLNGKTGFSTVMETKTKICSDYETLIKVAEKFKEAQ